MGQFVKYMVFGTHVYEILKTTFNVESYMCFMHFESAAFLCRVCLFEYLGQQHLQAMLAWAETELVENSKIKNWASHKNTLADGSFFSLSHLILIPLIFLHSVTEAIWVSHKNNEADGYFFHLSHLIPIPLIYHHSVTKVIWASHKNSEANGSTPKPTVVSSLSLIWYPFLSSFFTLWPRRSREACRVLKIFCHFSWEGLNPICLISDFLSRGNPFLPCFALAFTFTKICCLFRFFLN